MIGDVEQSAAALLVALVATGWDPEQDIVQLNLKNVNIDGDILGSFRVSVESLE